MCQTENTTDDHTTCTFFAQDIIAIGIAAGGYFCGALPMAVYAGQWGDGSLNGVNGTSAVQSSASATSVSYWNLKMRWLRCTFVPRLLIVEKIREPGDKAIP